VLYLKKKEVVMDEYLTAEELAEKLKVHRETVYRWVKGNKIPFLRLENGDYRFKQDEVEQVMRG